MSMYVYYVHTNFAATQKASSTKLIFIRIILGVYYDCKFFDLTLSNKENIFILINFFPKFINTR